jgi:hypothetical protein
VKEKKQIKNHGEELFSDLQSGDLQFPPLQMMMMMMKMMMMMMHHCMQMMMMPLRLLSQVAGQFNSQEQREANDEASIFSAYNLLDSENDKLTPYLPQNEEQRIKALKDLEKEIEKSNYRE